MKQIFHHYEKWEEHHAGMWRKITNEQERKEHLQRAIEFTGNAKLYGEYMLQVLDKWPISCEQNLSNSSVNRKAWIGHAATCIAINCPEDITREAWWTLSQDQQDEANSKAAEAIKKWEERYAKAS